MRNFVGTSVYQYFQLFVRSVRGLSQFARHLVKGVSKKSLRYCSRISLSMTEGFHFVGSSPPLETTSPSGQFAWPRLLSTVFLAQTVRSRDKFNLKRRHFKCFKCSRVDLHAKVAPVTFDLHLKGKEWKRTMDRPQTISLITNFKSFLPQTASKRASVFKMTLAVRCMCHRSSTLKVSFMHRAQHKHD